MTSTTPATPTVRRRAPSPNTLVAVLALAGITVSLQQTSVVALLPLLPRLLHASPADVSWAVTATLLAGAVATPTVGRLADMFGKRRMLLVCLGVLIAGSVIAALSTSLVPLIVGRALQGFAAGVIPLGISLMRDQLPPERLGSATALMSASLGVGGALGLPLSALLVEFADWHALFWAAGALALLATVLVVVVVAESAQRTGGRFDALGALLLSAALVSLLLAVSKGSSWGWGSLLTIGLFVLAAISLLAFSFWEMRVSAPLVDLRVSRRRQVLLTNTASAVFGYSMLTSSLVFPQLLQLPAITGYGFGQSILIAGLLQMPGGLSMMAMSPVSARISAASGPRTTLMSGAVVVALGYTFAALFHAHIWQLLVSTVVVSSGVGLAYGAMPSLIMAAVPRTQTAAANSLNNLSRALGTSVASAMAGLLLATLSTSVAGLTLPSEAAFVTILVIGAATAVIALGITVFIPRRPAADAAAAGPALTSPAGEDGAASLVRTVGAPDRADSGFAEAAAPVLVRGRVLQDGRPVGEAVLTLVAANGTQLGCARTDTEGGFVVASTTPGSPYLLVTRGGEATRADLLTGPAPFFLEVHLPTEGAAGVSGVGSTVRAASRPAPAVP